MPKEYLSFEGFRLTEEPRKRVKVLFLGGIQAWGDQDLKLCPKLEWLFHESDKVIASIHSPIVEGIAANKRKRFIDAENFVNLCEGLIPEKIHFILPDELIGPLALGTIAAVEKTGAHCSFSSEMIRLEQGIFLKYSGTKCEVKAERDLACFETAPGKYRPIAINKEKVLKAQGLGSFVTGDESGPCGIFTQVEFVQYENWEIERVRWESLNQTRLQRTRTISC